MVLHLQPEDFTSLTRSFWEIRVVVMRDDAPMMDAWFTIASSMKSSGVTSHPRSITVHPAPLSMAQHRLFPMMWMSPLTVPNDRPPHRLALDRPCLPDDRLRRTRDGHYPRQEDLPSGETAAYLQDDLVHDLQDRFGADPSVHSIDGGLDGDLVLAFENSIGNTVQNRFQTHLAHSGRIKMVWKLFGNGLGDVCLVMSVCVYLVIL